MPPASCLPRPGCRVGLLPDLIKPGPGQSTAYLEKVARLKAALNSLEYQLEASLKQAFGLLPVAPDDENLHQKVERLVAAIKQHCSELDALETPLGGA